MRSWMREVEVVTLDDGVLHVCGDQKIVKRQRCRGLPHARASAYEQNVRSHPNSIMHVTSPDNISERIGIVLQTWPTCAATDFGGTAAAHAVHHTGEAGNHDSYCVRSELV